MAPGPENFYQTLNLKNDCSAKEIKDAFISLSKKYHPDRTKKKEDHKLFLKINNAYSVLSKPAARRLYDQDLYDNKPRVYHHYYNDIYTTKPKNPNKPGFGNEPYYGIKGLKKLPNTVILAVCFTFAVIGIGIEFAAIKSSIVKNKEKRDHDSARNNILWEYAKKKAEANGNELQIKKFMDNTLQSQNLKEANEEYMTRLVTKNE